MDDWYTPSSYDILALLAILVILATIVTLFIIYQTIIESHRQRIQQLEEQIVRQGFSQYCSERYRNQMVHLATIQEEMADSDTVISKSSQSSRQCGCFPSIC